jgi:lytic murein transglycosylase
MLPENPAMRAFSLSVGLLIFAASTASADFASCVAGLRSAATTAGVSGSTFDRVMRDVEPDMRVIELMQNQPEFKTPIWDYLATLVDEQKVSEGRALLQKHASLLSRIEQAYGVDRHAVVAVWGVESDYGNISGGRFLPQALSTAACFGPRRREFFRGELISTLKIIERGDLAAEKLRGSWAGAFGHTQFIPSTYLRLAVDFDGDGKRDLVDSIPDALASTANYLKRSGWITGASWGYEVKLPSEYSGPSA